MRGLTTAAPVAGLALLLIAAPTGCGTAGGVRTEQSSAASKEPEAKASPLPASPAPTPEATDSAEPSGPAADKPLPTAASPVSPPGAKTKLDIVTLLRADRRVDAAVRRDLRPCGQKKWPIDVAYGKLTGGSAADVVINVSTCADGKGVGSYVYRADRSGKYVSVFSYEVPSVYAEIDKGVLRVYQDVYLKDDPRCCPSGEDVVTFGWQDDGFVQRERTYNEYPDYPETTLAPEPSWGRTGEGD